MTIIDMNAQGSLFNDDGTLNIAFYDMVWATLNFFQLDRNTDRNARDFDYVLESYGITRTLKEHAMHSRWLSGGMQYPKTAERWLERLVNGEYRAIDYYANAYAMGIMLTYDGGQTFVVTVGYGDRKARPMDMSRNENPNFQNMTTFRSTIPVTIDREGLIKALDAMFDCLVEESDAAVARIRTTYEVKE